MLTLNDVPARYRKMHERALAGKNPRIAIRAHCAYCMGWSEIPRAIVECTSKICPLYPYRIKTKPATTEPAQAKRAIEAGARMALAREARKQKKTANVLSHTDEAV
jgi:hypothetical protein